MKDPLVRVVLWLALIIEIVYLVGVVFTVTAVVNAS